MMEYVSTASDLECSSAQMELTRSVNFLNLCLRNVCCLLGIQPKINIFFFQGRIF